MTHTVFIQTFVYLAAAVLCVPIAKRLGLGSVLGYLLAGVAIGPAVLALVGEEGYDVMHFAEFGVVIMLFLVGIELEPALLWKLRTPILGLGGLQVLLTSLVLAGAALLTGLPWQPALALGMILSLSSTAIVLQTLKEKGLLTTPAGQNAFSVLLFQDIAVIPMLALLPLLATYPRTEVGGGDHSLVAQLPGWLQPPVILGAVGLVVGVGRFLMRPVFHAIGRTGLREVFIASALLLVVGVALLMEAVGLSPALGAFVAGVVLANSEYKHELESDIDPFKGLLLGLFFMSVGASIDFGLIAGNLLPVAGMVAGLLALKAAVLWSLGKYFKLSAGQNLTLALSLCQVGEFAFVLLSFARQNGILAADAVGLATAAVALTMALTPLVLLLNERLLLPRLHGAAEPAREADRIEEKHPVIIAGFGRYGSMVGRFLRANGVGTTVLDNNADRVETLRKLGLKVYYGDATRYDLLKASGAEEARLMIIALDAPEQSVSLVETVKKHFPHLTLLVRAYDRDDSYQLIEAGVGHVYRETLESSLRMGADALQLLGRRAYYAQRVARLFGQHDQRILTELAAVRGDQQQYFRTIRQRNAELEQLLQSDDKDRWLMGIGDGWDNASLRRETADPDHDGRETADPKPLERPQG
ncbi:MAG TPA: monovalent cation:proton antiporter-2 (CPA2) family protein [Cytophagales bacterium]|jgi:monovalent cation:proton antiporter-2 (CPA2) family protein